MHKVVEMAKHFYTASEPVNVRQLKLGNTNGSYIVTFADGQRIVVVGINRSVFTEPVKMMLNTAAVADFLAGDESAEHFSLLSVKKGKCLILDNKKYWYAYKYPNATHTPDFDTAITEIEEFGSLLGSFHTKLTAFPTDRLYYSIPDFHNTPKYIELFDNAAKNADAELVASIKGEVGFIENRRSSGSLLLNMNLPERATLNNVKLEHTVYSDETGKALFFTSYETVMPGIFAFDFGDAARATCFGCREDDVNMKKVALDIHRFTAFTNGYIRAARSVLTTEEIKSLVMGVRMLAFELGVRFLTDYLSGNKYFKVESPEHNLIRARNQLLICAQVEKNYNRMCTILVDAVKNCK